MTAPWIANDLDGFQTASGTPDLATGSVLTGMRLNAAGEAVTSEQQTSRTTGGSGMTFEFNSTNATQATVIEWRNSSNTAVLRVRVSATATVMFEYLNSSSVWTQVGSSYTFTAGQNIRMRLAFTNMGNASTGALSLKFYNTSDTLLHTMAATGLNLSVATNVAYLYRATAAAITNLSTLHYLCDQADDTLLFAHNTRPNANGTDTGASAGSYASVDESTGDPDADYLTLTNSGDKHSVKSAARSYGGRYIRGVSINARMRRGATGPTQVKPYLLIGGVRYYHSSSPVTLTTTFQGYVFPWETDPSTSNPWINADVESASLEWGIENV